MSKQKVHISRKKTSEMSISKKAIKDAQEVSVVSKMQEDVANAAVASMESHETFTLDLVVKETLAAPTMAIYAPEAVQAMVAQMMNVLLNIGMLVYNEKKGVYTKNMVGKK